MDGGVSGGGGVHVSRSVFSERFTALVGVPPLLHLTRWRMHLATRWLRDERASLGQVASRLGYEPSSPEIGFAAPSSGDAQKRTG